MEIVRRASLCIVLVGCGVLSACSLLESEYFQGKVNEVTQETVASRYGEPHKQDQLPDGRSAWTYFDRGSSTSGYGSYVRRPSCKAYVLTFDDRHVLRDWKQQGCTAQTATD